jgi:FAD/FMN-containing dehydrogenase/Fe-S oxidoreductase
MFDPSRRERIHDDLREMVRGDLMFDSISRGLYATDASIFESEPLGVVAPRDDKDLQTVVRYCHTHRIPMIARGGGTGLAGESLGSGLVLDLSRHFRQIVEIGSDFVKVQPGVVHQQLNAALAPYGRQFPPDPTSSASCTIGGMIATNASGARCVKYGYTRAYLQRLKIVLDNGDLVDVGLETMTTTSEAPTRLAEIVRGTAALLRQHENAIRSDHPATPFNRCGYGLHGVLSDAGLDLPKLLAGSEGTLALIAEATLRTVPRPGGVAAVLLGFASLEAALRTVTLARKEPISACELLDRRLVSLARAAVPATADLLPPNIECALLVEFEADRPSEARRLGEQFFRIVHERMRCSLVGHFSARPEDVDRFWSIRQSSLPNLYGLTQDARPIALIEDIGVPPDSLGAFLTRVQEILQAHNLTASFLIHAASGQVHVRPFIELARQDIHHWLWGISEAIYELVLSLGGTISSQHGTGLARTPWVPRQYPRLYPVFVGLKAVFDPHELLNPGKIVSAMSPTGVWPIRRRLLSTPAKTSLSLVWSDGSLASHAAQCNGCGHCRLEDTTSRMCPMFRVTHEEAATPRAKANLLRQILESDTPKRLADDDVRAVADLCINCRMCALECPAHLPIPKMMLEAKAAHHAEHGLDRADWFLSRIELFAALGSRLSLIVNPLLESRLARWAIERLFGVSRHRRLPLFARQSFLRRWQKKQRRLATKQRSGVPSSPSSSSPPRVAYFVDVFANYNDPQIAEATVAVLEHNGIEVHVPDGQWSSGMASLAMGDVEMAKELADANLRILADLAREGYRIVCSEPTAALMLSQDYLDLRDDPVTRLVAHQTVELTTYLGELLDQGRLRTDFQPLRGSVGYHIPCHLKALRRPIQTPRLLKLIPDLDVTVIDVSCSGMAGTFGLKRRNYWASLEAGRPMLELMRRPRVLFGVAECSSCRMQMEEGAGKRTLHPIQLLALAYGILPEVAERLREPMSAGGPS